MLPTLFLFFRTSLSLVASPDVNHQEQGAKVHNRVRVSYLCLDSFRGTLNTRGARGLSLLWRTLFAGGVPEWATPLKYSRTRNRAGF